MSAAASLGLSLLWDTDAGISQADKYTYSADEHIKVIFFDFHIVCRIDKLKGWRPPRNWNVK